MHSSPPALRLSNPNSNPPPSILHPTLHTSADKLASQLIDTILRSQLPAYSFWPLSLRRTFFTMAAPNHNIFPNEDYNYDFNQWVYVEADSSQRPPVYNAANRPCTDMAGYSEGQTYVPQPAASPQGCQFESRANTFYQPPRSEASSTASAPSPEGVEREYPNLAVTNSFLPLVPEAGLNEIPHRRSASFRSDMSYQMRRFLVDQQKDQPRRNSSPPAQDRFLPQDLYIQSSKKQAKSKKRSKNSYQSFESYSSEDRSFPGYGTDVTACAGNWIDDERLCYGFSSTLSGMTDELNGE